MPISICGLLLLGAMVAAPQGAKNASGKFTVGDQSTELRYVRAREGKDPFDSTQRQIRVVLSDAPITDDDMDHPFALGAEAHEGKVHAVEVLLSLKGEPTGGSLYHQAFGPGYVTVSGMHRFERTILSGKTIAGKLYMEEPSDLMDTTFIYEATFSTALEHEAKPTAEGEAAAASGPGKAVLEYFRAGRAHDLAALKKVCTKEKMIPFNGPDSTIMLDSLGEYLKGIGSFTILRVYENGDHAKVEAQEKDRDGNPQGVDTINTVRVEGDWKVAD